MGYGIAIVWQISMENSQTPYFALRIIKCRVHHVPKSNMNKWMDQLFYLYNVSALKIPQLSTSNISAAHSWFKFANHKPYQHQHSRNINMTFFCSSVIITLDGHELCVNRMKMRLFRKMFGWKSARE